MTSSTNHATPYELDLARLGDLIADIKVAMLTTRDEDGTLRSRPMGTQSADAFEGTLYFFTDIDSAKIFEVEDSRAVNVSYAEPGSQKYASLSGNASVTQDRDQLEAHWNPMLKVWFPQGLDDPKVALLSIDVVKAEFWDSPSKPAMLFAMAKAALTGTRVDGGEDKQLNLKRGTSATAVH